MAKWLGQVALIALAYLVAGRIGQFLAAPPIYATAVWPASGVAVAGLLLLGYRVIPGLFVGALVVNSWSTLVAGNESGDVIRALSTACGISIGATLQAFAGAWLVRRYVGFPNDLTKERDVLNFLTLSGPVSCVIGATIGVRSLVASGAVSHSQFVSNWWTWWVGDVIGVIIVAPLVLIFFAEPRKTWRRRRLTVALPLCITLVAVAITFAYTHVAERQQTRLKFERRVSSVFDSVKESVERYLDVVHSMQGFFAGSVEVTREEFDVFHRHLLERHKGIQALEWIPQVTQEERSDYERMVRDVGFSDFEFTERTAKNDLVPAAERPVYFPVFFVVPHQGNEAAFGYDLGSDEARLSALRLSRDTGEQIATAPVTLVQDSGGQPGFLAAMPVYDHAMANNSLDSRRANLRGFVVGAFRVSDIITDTLTSLEDADFELAVIDTNAPTGRNNLFDTRGRQTNPKAAESLPLLAREIRWTTNYSVAGRPWSFDFVPNQRFFAAEGDGNTWLVLAGGLLLTSLLSVFLMIVSGRATQVEELVVERTKELTAANRELEHEIAERMRFEAELSRTQEGLERRVEERTADLKASETRFQDLYHHAPDMFVSVNIASQRLIECNVTFLSVTGFDKDEVIGRRVFELYDEDSQETARSSFRAFLKTGHVKDVELKLLRKDKPPLEVSLNVSAVRDDRGQLLHSRAVLRDISATKAAEARIKKHEAELAHVARLSTMGEMAAGLAHEINQPLAAIAAYAEGVALRMRNGNLE
ncbi:MAG: CHASE domain-containing protein, partial [Pirellulales bacterium]|nr:CHASE domain-containing protein [Pirellulales bacterium]